MPDIYGFLKEHGISYERHDHPAVFTCEEALRTLPKWKGAHTKNLFLRDEKGKRHFLVVVDCSKRVDLKALRKALGIEKLSFASPERLQTYLGVDPGSVTLLGLMNDRDHSVEVILDRYIFESDFLQCHPLTNRGTLVISHEGIETFLKATGHSYKVIEVPERSPPPEGEG